MFVQTEFNKSNNNNDISRSRDVGSDSCFDGLFKDLDLISRFCMPICSRDNEIREVALDVISKTVEGWLDGVGSPKHYRMAQTDLRRLQNASNGCACSDIVGNTVNDVPKEYLELITLHLPIILRLSISCPFINVREKCQHILEIVQSRGLPIPYPVISGPSAYIDSEELPPLGTFNEKASESSVDDPTLIKDEPLSDYSDTESTTFKPPSPKLKQQYKKRRHQDTNNVAVAGYTGNEIYGSSSVAAPAEDEFDVFGRHVACQLRQLNIYRALDLETKIQLMLSKERAKDIRQRASVDGLAESSKADNYDDSPVPSPEQPAHVLFEPVDTDLNDFTSFN